MTSKQWKAGVMKGSLSLIWQGKHTRQRARCCHHLACSRHVVVISAAMLGRVSGRRDISKCGFQSGIVM